MSFSIDGLEYVHSEARPNLPRFSHPLTGHSSGFVGPFDTTTFSRTRKNKSRAQAPHRINSGGVQKNAKTNPSSKGRGCFHPYTGTKMSTFNVSTSSLSSNTVLSESAGRKEDGRKAQRLLPISTSSSLLLPPATATNNGCKAYKKSPDVGRWVEWERKRSGE